MLATVIVFTVVYVGMIFGTLPGLKLNRAAIALIGAIVLLALNAITRPQALGFVDFNTVGLLFGLMVVSATYDLSGCYFALSGYLSRLALSPSRFLAVIIGISGLMSAVLTNDVVAIALTPVVLGHCIESKLNPKPYLLGLAFATNAGSVATIIGSPQNMLISQHFHLSFMAFSAQTAVPALLTMGIIWLVLNKQYQGNWALPDHVKAKKLKHRKFNHWESSKSLVVTLAIIILFIGTNWSHDLIALGGAALLLANAHFSSHKMLHRVDWELLILVVCLFVVNGAMQQTGLPKEWIADLNSQGINLLQPAVLFVVTAVLSDIVSNIPSVMLLLPFVSDPSLGPLMAIASGLSSNLIVIGSLASIIVVNAAARRHLPISFMEFARSGVPITLASIVLSGLWLWLLSL